MDLPVGHLRKERNEESYGAKRAVSAQADQPGKQIVTLLIRGFWVRAPGAPPTLNCGFVPLR